MAYRDPVRDALQKLSDTAIAVCQEWLIDGEIGEQLDNDLQQARAALAEPSAVEELVAALKIARPYVAGNAEKLHETAFGSPQNTKDLAELMAVLAKYAGAAP